MNRRFLVTAAATVVILTATSTVASAGIPWVGVIDYFFQQASSCIFPDGSGHGLDEAVGPDGVAVDATIRVLLVDSWYNPIANFPSEDMWLQYDTPGGTVAGCVTYPGFDGGVFLPDAATDVDGWTEFISPLRGGGWSEGPARFYLNGSPAQDPGGITHPSIPLRVNSPDLNGDRVVNLSDISYFAQDLFGAYAYRSDFNWDGTVNLSDITVFVTAIGVDCD